MSKVIDLMVALKESLDKGALQVALCSTPTTVETSEFTYERHIVDGEPEWWRRNRVYGERTMDHLTRVLDYGGLELSSALDALIAARSA